MKFIVWLLVAVVLFLLVGVLPVGESWPDIVFRSPVFIVLLGAIACSSLVCCFVFLRGCRNPNGRGLKQMGIILIHASVALILAGAFLRYLFGEEGTFLLPVAPPDYVNTSCDGKLSLDFGVSAADLEISYYEPTHYDLLVPSPGANAIKEAHQFSRKVNIPSDGPLVIDEHVQVELSEMKGRDGNWKPFHLLADGSVLRINRIVSRYSATLHFEGSDGETLDEDIAVNHPATFQKWRFCLMSAEEGQPYIVLSGKKDPGWPLVRVGIWMMTACMKLSTRLRRSLKHHGIQPAPF